MTRAALLALAILAGQASAQSLFRENPQTPIDESGSADLNAPLRGVSLLFVESPKPKKFLLNDQISIVINETSRSQSSQTLDTKKDYTLAAALKQFPDLAALLDGELRNGASNPVLQVGASGNNKFKGKGSYERSDRFSDRVTATVIDVKPNGVLVLEARRQVEKDEEKQTLVISGSVRSQDVTDANTVLSTQLADLTIQVKNEGKVKEAGSKGLIPRVLDAVFGI